MKPINISVWGIDHRQCRKYSTGDTVRCLECHTEAENIDEIPHDPGRPQQLCRSEWLAAFLPEETPMG